MAVTVRAASAAHAGLAANTSTFTWAIPPAAEPGDVAVVACGANTGAAQSFATPTGWWQLGVPTVTGSNHTSQLFAKVLTAADIAAGFTTTIGVGARLHGGGIVFAGAKGIPAVVEVATDTTLGSTVAAAPVTTTSVDNLIVGIGLLRSTAATAKISSSPSAGWTKRVDNGTAFTTIPNFAIAIATRDDPAGTAGAYAGPTWTVSDPSSAGHGWTLAIEPASAAPAPGPQGMKLFINHGGVYKQLTSWRNRDGVYV